MEKNSAGFSDYADLIDENTAYENLGNAVIERAVEDMAIAILKIEMANRVTLRRKAEMSEIDKFFSSDRLKILTTVDPELLRNVAINQGKYLIWKHDRGCSGCKYGRSKKCAHGRGGASNWYAWKRGDKHCVARVRNNRPEVDELPELDFDEV